MLTPTGRTEEHPARTPGLFQALMCSSPSRPAAPQPLQTHSCLRAFVLAVPSAWNTVPLDFLRDFHSLPSGRDLSDITSSERPSLLTLCEILMPIPNSRSPNPRLCQSNRNASKRHWWFKFFHSHIKKVLTGKLILMIFYLTQYI